MKASKWNAISLVLAMLPAVGVLSWGVFSLSRIDLVSEPFGSLMVMGRTLFVLAVLAVTCEFMGIRSMLSHQAVRVRTPWGHS